MENNIYKKEDLVDLLHEKTGFYLEPEIIFLTRSIKT